MNKKLLSGGLVLLAAVFCVLAFFGMLAAGAMVLGSGVPGFRTRQELPDVAVVMEGPRTVEVDTLFVVQVSLTNKADTPRTLVEVDMSGEAADTFAMFFSSPPYLDAWRTSNYQAYRFDEEIPPGETLSILLPMSAHVPGTYPLNLGFCIDESDNCALYGSDVVVK